jgi:hypothetical protein
MTINRAPYQPCLISENSLRKSKTLMRKRIKAYRDEIRISDDEQFIEARRRKIYLLKLIVKDMTILINDLQ